ncbi:MAG: GntR family transcriptional regulator [Terricaulis sp.]
MATTTETPTSERAYQEIKARLMAGRFRLRQRLDASAIASDLGVSTTPVREALLRLTAERLVAFRPSHGFSAAMWSESGLRDLYRWRGELAEIALGSVSALSRPTIATNGDYPTRAAALLAGLQSGSHAELVASARNADERLHIARVAERELWSEVDEELALITEAIEQGDVSGLKLALRLYHDKRIAAAKAIRDCAALLGLPSNGA